MMLREIHDLLTKLRRVLRAHEALAALNEQNRQQFEKLVEYLRKEVQEECNST